jgi:segregation and condensation protein B
VNIDLHRIIEALLFVSADPVPANQIAQLTETSLAEVEETLRDLAAGMAGRGLVLREVAGGWRLATDPELAPYVERFVLQIQQPRLTQAALETLAVVAYKQPVTRAQVAAIRGVDSDSSIATLREKGFVREVGIDPGPGNAQLFGTTMAFLERLGLSALEELPEIGPLMPDLAVADGLEP